MKPPVVAILVALALVFGVAAVQWRVTSPGVVTYGEFRLLILAAVPSMVTILSAWWVDAGRRTHRTRGR